MQTQTLIPKPGKSITHVVSPLTVKDGVGISSVAFPLETVFSWESFAKWHTEMWVKVGLGRAGLYPNLSFTSLRLWGGYWGQLFVLLVYTSQSKWIWRLSAPTLPSSADSQVG